MAYFPLFVELEKKTCLVIGGGAVAFRKTKTLLEFGAKVKAIAPLFAEEFLTLEGNPYFRQEKREFQKEDIREVFLVIAATNQSELNQIIGKLCREAGIYCNLADNRENSSFLFPASIKRDSVVIGITTGGKSPALAKDLRERIEGMVEKAYGKTADEMEKLRKKVKESGLTKEQRKKVFHQLADELLSEKITENPIQEGIIDQIIKEERGIRE